MYRSSRPAPVSPSGCGGSRTSAAWSLDRRDRWRRRATLTGEVRIGIVREPAVGKCIPQGAKVVANLIDIVTWYHRRFLVEEPAHTPVRIEQRPDALVIGNASVSLRGDRTNDVHPSRDAGFVHAVAPANLPPGIRVAFGVEQIVVELGPRVVFRPHVHRPARIQEVEREGEDTTGALQLEIERRGLAERGKQRECREHAGSQVE